MSGKANESAVKKGLLFRPASRAEIMRAGAERAEVTVEQVVRELKLIEVLEGLILKDKDDSDVPRGSF
jgi:hypothetical protein